MYGAPMRSRDSPFDLHQQYPNLRSTQEHMSSASTGTEFCPKKSNPASRGKRATAALR
jgi:hypothetical protein